MKKKFISGLLALFCIMASFSASFAADNENEFQLSLQKSSIMRDETTTITLDGINLNDIYAFEVILNFDPEYVEFKKAETNLQGIGTELIQDGERVTFAFTGIGDAPGLSGNVQLARFTVAGKKKGSTDILLSLVKVVNPGLTRVEQYLVSDSVKLNILEPLDGEPDEEPGGDQGKDPAPEDNEKPGDVKETGKDEDSGSVGSIEHELGTIEVSDQITVLHLSSEALQSILSGQSDSIVIHMNDTGQSGTLAVDIQSDLLKEINAANKDIVIQMGNVTISIPQGSIELAEVTEDVRVAMEFGPVSPADNKMRSFSGAYTFSIKSRNEGVLINKPIKISLDLTEGSDFRKAGVYCFDMKTGNWVYTGGKLNKDKTALSFEISEVSGFTFALFQYEKNYVDVPEHYWAWDNIQVLTSRHIVQGVSDSRFLPEGSVTRAEFAAMCVRLLGLSQSSSPAMFNDVPPGSWFENVIATAADAGILQGDGDGNVRPYDSITRQEMAVVAMRVLNYLTGNKAGVSGEAEPFADHDSIAPWALEAVYAARHAGLLTGRPGYLFEPLEYTTRAEAAAIIYRLLEKSQW